MNNVTFGSFLREVEKMNGTGAMGHVNGDIANLTETVCFLIQAHEFGYFAGVCGAYPTRGDMCGKGGC